MKKIVGFIIATLLFFSPFLIQTVEATVSTSSNKVIYSGDGQTNSFAFSFNIFAKSDLIVQVYDNLNVTHTLVLNTDYTVSTTTFPGNGNVVLLASGNWPNIPTGDELIILRQIPITQLINESDNSYTPAAVRNQAYDRACMIEQQLQEQINRTVLWPSSFTSSASIPNPESGLVLGWDANGNLVNISASTVGSLAVPIADSNLQQITTSSKVSGTAVTGLASLPSGAGVIPLQNLPTANTPSKLVEYSNEYAFTASRITTLRLL